MSSDSQSLPLHIVDLHVEKDIVVCRQHARQFASALGFDLQTQTRIATAVSEIARNAYQYASGGVVEFLSDCETNSQRRFDLRRQSFIIIIRDQGPGIPHLKTILEGDYRSTTGMGLGIIGARRLMDTVDIQSDSKGTVITLQKNLPPSAARKTDAQIQSIAVIQSEPAAVERTVIAEVQRQNQELITVMDEVRLRQEDLDHLNKELEDTNAGVLALYDELETLHRVGLLLASKIDLPAVMQTLIEATTDLTGAQFGVCYMLNKKTGHWERYADAGPKRDLLSDLPKTQGSDFFGSNFGEEGLTHVPDMEDLSEPSCMSDFSAALDPSNKLRSCLAFPLKAENNSVVGALIFGSSEPRFFSERSERIVSSIAAQAIVAVEKARLFDSVKSASEAKDRFLAMLSHELRTPLNPVLSIVSDLHQNPSFPKEFQEDIAVVLRNVQLEARLIDDLLDFQRIIKGNFSFASEPVDAHSIIETVVNICKHDLLSHKHHLTLNLDAPRFIVIGDPARLQQILWNVLKNAIKFTPIGGDISITTELGSSDQTLCIVITDTGRGIENEMLEGIFNAFEQGSLEGTTEFGGLGLGLAIVKAFIEKLGGTVKAESAGRDHGTKMILSFPLVDVLAPGIAPVLEPTDQKPGLIGGKAQHVLLVDDHFDTLESLSRILARKGYVVTTAVDCASAFTLAQNQTFDVICSDLGLPDGSGLDLMIDIRKLGITTPSIALSGYGMESDVAQAQDAGFQKHLTKPVSMHALLSALAGVLAD
ncbi:ATP-binding protein [Phragmitibacter flavus]|nr:ATP-binding protein [Phragmitibacter flavus]